MLDMYFFARVRIVDAVFRVRVGIQAHVARYQAALSCVTSFRIDDAVAPLCGLDEFGVLLFENLEVPLGLPVPDRVGREHEIHFFESTLVGLRVEGPDDDDRSGVDGTEEVKRLFAEFFEDGGKKKHLYLRSADDYRL